MAAGGIKMGAGKPMQVLQLGLPSILEHAVKNLMGFTPLSELP